MLTLLLFDRCCTTISRRFQEFNDPLDGVVGFVHCGFEFAVGLEVGIGMMIEQAVGKRATKALVEENEHHGDLDALVGESIGVSRAVAFE